MPILNSGSTTTVTLGAYDSITLQNRSGQAASISVGGTVVNGNHSGSRTYGPYPSGGSVSLNAISGDLYYEVADGAGDTKRVFARGSALLAEDGSTVSAGGGESLTQRMLRFRRNNPAVNGLASGVTVAVNAAPSANTTAEFNDLNTGNFTSNQGADYYVNYGGMYPLGSVKNATLTGTPQTDRTNGGIGIHWFRTASPEIDVYMGSSASATARYRVLIDEGDGIRYTDRIGYAPPTSGTGYLNISFADTAPKMRIIGIEHILDVNFKQVRVLPNHTVRPAETGRPVWVKAGDSTVELTVGETGTGFTRAAVWQSHMRDMTGFDVRGLAIGGTGFVNAGTNIPFSHDNRINQIINLSCSGASWICSTNDAAASASDLRAATLKVLDAVRAAKGSQFPMVFFGMYGGGTTSNTNHVNVETAVLNAVRERIDAGDKYVAVRPHLTSGDVIPTALTIGSDASHNTVNGYRLIGNRIVTDLYSALYEMGL